MAIDVNAMFTLSYGLFVLTANEDGRDCGSIVNTVSQLTDSPLRVAVAVNKNGYTEGVIRRTGKFNASVLTEDAGMDLFRHFGFQSSRDVDKFAGRDDPVSENGLRYLKGVSNALISAETERVIDCETHTLFIARVTQAERLNNRPSMTYAYYFANVKPKKQETRRGYVCKICGYFHEGEHLPPDFICPWCKHGAQDFERVGF